MGSCTITSGRLQAQVWHTNQLLPLWQEQRGPLELFSHSLGGQAGKGSRPAVVDVASDSQAGCLGLELTSRDGSIGGFLQGTEKSLGLSNGLEEVTFESSDLARRAEKRGGFASGD